MLLAACTVVSLNPYTSFSATPESSTTADRPLDTSVPPSEIQPVVIFNMLPMPEIDSLFRNEEKLERYDFSQSEYEVRLDELRERYDIDYKVYSKGEYLGIKAGRVRGDYQLNYFFDIDLEFNCVNPFDSYIAVDARHDIVPAVLEFADPDSVNAAVIEQINRQFGVSISVDEVIGVDLDGDGVKESIITGGDTENYFTANVLLGGTDNIIAYMQYHKMENESPWRTETQKESMQFKQFWGEIADINDDGIMEIFFIYRFGGGMPDILTYSKGAYSGDSMYEISWD